MNNKRRIYQFVLFPIITLLLLLLYAHLVDVGVRHSPEEGFKKVNAVLEWQIDPDIMAFGSSVGEKSFNSNVVAAKTNKTTYNDCIDGANFEQYKGLVEQYIDYSSKKNLVLFFESYFSLQRIHAISSVERYAAYLTNPHMYKTLYDIDPSLTWRSRYIPLYKNTVVDHTYYKASLLGWKSMLKHIPMVDSLQGFVPSYAEWMQDEDAALDSMAPLKIVIQKDVINDYIAIIRRLEQKGKKVAIVFPPIYERLYKEKVNYTELMNTMDSISRVAGCTLLNFSMAPMSREKKYFYNTNHLNYGGSQIFAAFLSDTLRNKGLY